MSSGRSFTTSFKTSYESAALSKYQEDLQKLKFSLRDNKKEQKELSKEIRNAKAEITAIEKETKESGKTTEEQEKRLKVLQAVIENDTKALEGLKLKQAQLQAEISNTNKKIEDERKALDKLKSSLSDAKKYSVELVKECGALGAAASAAVAGLLAFTKDAAAWADDLNTLSKTTGISTEELQKFAYASDLIDVSVDTMTGALTKLTRSMQSASESGTSAAAEAFTKLNISITDATGHLRDRQEVFYEAIDALGKIENVTERDAIAMNIFGKSAQELNPLILGGADTLKSLGEEAERAGLILEQKTLNGLNGFNDKLDLLKSKGTAIKHLAASEMTPALEGLLEVADDLLDDIKKMAKSGELKKVAKEAGEMIKKGAEDIRNIISFVWKYKDAISAVVQAMVVFKISMSITGLINSLVISFKLMGAEATATATKVEALNLALATNPYGLVISAVVALATALLSLAGSSAEVTHELSESVKLSQELWEESQEYADSIRRVKESGDDLVHTAQGEIKVLEMLGDEYESLRNKQELTASEKERLDTIAGQIASTMGVETQSLKDQAGAYRDLTLEIDAYSEKLLKKAKTAGYESWINEAVANESKLEANVAEIAAELEEAKKKLSDAMDDFKKELKENKIDDEIALSFGLSMDPSITAAQHQISALEKRLMYANSDLTSAKNEVAKAKIAYKDYLQDSQTATRSSTEALSEYNTELEENTKLLNRADDALADTAEGQTELEKKLSAANAAFTKNQTALKQARANLEAAQNAFQKEIEKGGDDPERINELKTQMDAAARSVSGLIGKQAELQESLKDVKEEIAAESAAGADLTTKIKNLSQNASALRSEMNSLAGTLKQLAAGEELSLDALIGLTEKYPDYTDMLLSAAGNAEAQKKAVELLFNAKKQDYILTQQAAIDNINASNEETRVKLANIALQIGAMQLAQSITANVYKSGKGNVLELFAQMQETSNTLNNLKKQFDDLDRTLTSNESKISQYQQRINAINKLTFSDFASGSGSGGSGGSGGGTSSGSEKKETYWRRGKGIYAEGDSYIKAYENWMTRAKNLGRLTVQEEIKILEELLRRRSNTADEQYEIEYKLYQARSQLQKQEQEAASAAAKAAEEKLLERQNLALAAFNKLTNAKIEAYQREADEAKKAADAQIKAIDDVENKRKQAQEDDKRQRELEQIKTKLTYGHNLTATERYDLERRRQDILNEQYEANRERGVAVWKSNIQSGYEDVQSRSQQAIEGLQAAQTGIADRVAYMQGRQSYDQRVSNNSKTVNVQLINNGLTADQAANRIVQKVLKELG